MPWFRITYLLFFILVSLNLRAESATVHVPGDFPTIQQAIDAVINGDTILIASGGYSENLNFSGKSIALLGAGSKLSKLISSSIMIEQGEGVGTKIGEIGFENGAQVFITVTNSSLTLENCSFTSYTGTDVTIRCNPGATLSIQKCLFYDNLGISCVGIYGGDASIINNTFDSNARGFFRIGGTAIAKNNIVTNSTDYGIHGVYTSQDYNDVWNNDPNYQGGGVAGPNSISLDPLYLLPSNGNYELRFDSPCIDAGDPNPLFVDIDGTVSDIGAFSFLQASPFITVVSIPAEDQVHVLGSNPVFEWFFFDSAGIQLSYEVEVGSDSDWTVAELWSSGIVTSSDTFTTYAGSTLIDGESYYVRNRAEGPSGLTDWKLASFRMNSLPSTPVHVFPFPGEEVHFQSVALAVSNSIDPEGDFLSYDFEVYSDSNLITLVFSDSSVQQQQFATASDTLVGLAPNSVYWWRARANDGFENSEWSRLTHFPTRGQKSLRVPTEFSTIQEAIDASFHGDTVLVADGVYTGAGNRDLDFGGRLIVLTSENGSMFTSIDCEGSASNPHRAVTFSSGENSTAILDGFTIRGGYGPVQSTVGRSAGGAIYCESVGPTIRNCRFVENIASLGGAISIVSSGILIEDCTFERNRNKISTGAAIGGGAVSSDASLLTIVSCTFDNNSSGGIAAGGYGGAVAQGIHFGFGGTLTISNCTFRGNTASVNGGAVSSRPFATITTIDSCTFEQNAAPVGGAMAGVMSVNASEFRGNTADNSGGACYLNGSPRLINCLFVSNSVRPVFGSLGGGAIFTDRNCTIDSCTFEKNTARTGGAIAALSRANLTIRN